MRRRAGKVSLKAVGGGDSEIGTDSHVVGFDEYCGEEILLPEYRDKIFFLYMAKEL